MKLSKLNIVAALTLSASAALAANPMVGGAAMYENKTIVENAVNSADHETLVAAVQAAGLVDTLQSDGPFTVFAPTDDAFGMLKPGTVETLLKPENKEALAKVLTCHVVAADVMSTALVGMIEENGGVHEVPTVGGCTLKASYDNGIVTLTDERGRNSTVTIADVKQSNGVIHVIDSVLLPAM